MPKLSGYVQMAASEYFQTTGRTELDARWIAEFFQESGVQDEYPRQDLVAFAHLVQKALTRDEDRRRKQSHLRKERVSRQRR